MQPVKHTFLKSLHPPRADKIGLEISFLIKKNKIQNFKIISVYLTH